MPKKKETIEIGQKVFVIGRDCNIEEKEVFAVINEGDKIGYTLDKHTCGGYSEDDVFITKAKAEVALKNFLDELKFRVGDLIVFEYKDYSNKKRTLGRIVAIKFSSTPYEIRGSYKEFDSISEEQILMKVRNEFIENFGNLQELYEEFKEKEKEIGKIISSIIREHDNLEKELETSIRKNYGIFHWAKSKPRFQDRFDYREERYYD